MKTETNKALPAAAMTETEDCTDEPVSARGGGAHAPPALSPPGLSPSACCALARAPGRGSRVSLRNLNEAQNRGSSARAPASPWTGGATLPEARVRAVTGARTRRWTPGQRLTSDAWRMPPAQAGAHMAEHAEVRASRRKVRDWISSAKGADARPPAFSQSLSLLPEQVRSD